MGDYSLWPEWAPRRSATILERHKNRNLCAKTAPISGGRGRLLIDVPIVFAQEKIQFPLRQEEREGERREEAERSAVVEYLYTKARQEAHRVSDRPAELAGTDPVLFSGSRGEGIR